jgi:hypothetical protein
LKKTREKCHFYKGADFFYQQQNILASLVGLSRKELATLRQAVVDGSCLPSPLNREFT